MVLVAACLAVLFLISQATTGVARAEQTITVAPDDPNAENNFPFGTGQSWIPFMGFVYKDIPAFQLKPNDVLAFDLNKVNEADDRLDIAMAPTTINGGDIPAGAFTPIVSKTQLPANPRGDTIDGNYELQYKADTAFDFPGGGLIIRFSNPGTQLAADDGSSEGPLHNGGDSTDTSGFFVERFLRDSDGVYPWPDMEILFSDIAAFRLKILDAPPPPPPADTTATTPGTSKKKKCKKKHKKHSASAAKKKKCKKKRR